MVKSILTEEQIRVLKDAAAMVLRRERSWCLVRVLGGNCKICKEIEEDYKILTGKEMK